MLGAADSFAGRMYYIMKHGHPEKEKRREAARGER
jgi:hypothetical protein